MKTFLLLIIALISAQSQTKIWVKVDSGSALYLDPYTSKWIPINAREEVPLKTYIVIKENSQVELFRETETVRINEPAYFFIEDAFVRDQYQILSKLTRIEAQYFPKSEQKDQKRHVGLIYGSKAEKKRFKDIPNFYERRKAVEQFINLNLNASALLSQKRMMSQFPKLYSDYENLKRLLILYDFHNLSEYIFEETKRLETADLDQAVKQLITTYRDNARQKLTQN